MHQCVDHRSINNLLTPVTKAHSMAKLVAGLVHLPKVDDMYVNLSRSKTYSTLNLRGGYHDTALMPKSQKKSTFLIPMRNGVFVMFPSG